MPAAAVTPAPIAYIKVAAVKKLVVAMDFCYNAPIIFMRLRRWYCELYLVAGCALLHYPLPKLLL